MNKTLDEIIDLFMSNLDLADTSKTSYGNILRQYSKYLKENNIDAPKEADLLRYKKYLKNRIKSASVQKMVVVLRKFYKWYAKHGYGTNIADEIAGEKIEATFKRESLTLEQAKKIQHKALIMARKSITHYRNYVIIKLILTTGLRTIEVKRADVSDLGTIAGQKVLYIMGKGHDDKDSYVKLSNEVVDLITNYLMNRNSDNEALFVNHAKNSSGTRIDTKTISNMVKELMRKIGLDSKKYTAHSLRHTYATLALKNGAKLQEVQMVLRHKDIGTTTIYAHNISREENNAELVVGKLLDTQKKNKKK